MKYGIIYYPSLILGGLLFPIFLSLLGLAYGLCSYLFLPWYMACDKLNNISDKCMVRTLMFIPMVIGHYIIFTLFGVFCLTIWALVFTAYYIFVILLVPMILCRFCIP